MSTKISELSALSGSIPATNAVPISVSGTTYRVNLGDLAELNGSADVKTALAAANKAALSDAVVDGTAIDPSSTGETTPGSGKFSSLDVDNSSQYGAILLGTTNQLQGFDVTAYGPVPLWLMNTAGFSFKNDGSCVLIADGSDILAQRRGTNLQESRLYGTYTSSTNYERLSTKYDSGAGAFIIGTEKGADGGSVRSLSISINGTSWATITATGTVLGENNTITSFFSFGDPTCQIGGSTGQGVTVRARGGYGFSSDTNTGTHALRDTVIHRTGAGIATVTTGAYNDPMGFMEDLYRRKGSGSPEGVITAPVGAVYHRTDGGLLTSFYVKESGAGNTGWVGK